MKKITLLLISMILELAAHTLWIDNGFNVHQGHITQSHIDDMASLVSLKALKKITCLNENNISDVDSLTLLKDKTCEAVYISLEPKYYTKTPYGTKNVSKDKVKVSLKSWQSKESVKRVYANNAKKIFGNGLEIVFRNKLSEIEVGDKARLKVYFNGKPISKVAIANGHRTIGMTDSEGNVNVKLRNIGLQVINASYEIKSDGILCDKIIYATTLNFEIKE